MMRSSSGCSAAAGCWASGAAPGSFLSAMMSSSGSGGGRRGTGLQGLLGFGVVDDLLQQGVQLVVAVQLGEQVHQLLAGVEQPAQGLDLFDHLDRAEVVDVAEIELDVQLGVVLGQLVVGPQ